MIEYKKLYLFQEDEYDDIMDIVEFIDFTKTGATPDDGGVVNIIVDNFVTNLHLGIWMLSKEGSESVSCTFDDLLKLAEDHIIEVNWANK